MKTTLKGHYRYQPGCCYALLIMFPIELFLFIAAMPFLEKLGFNGDTIMIAILAIALPLYLISFKIGKMIFGFTEKKLLRVCKTYESAERLATLIEGGVLFAVLGLLLGGTFLMEHIRDGAADTAQELNGWDG